MLGQLHDPPCRVEVEAHECIGAAGAGELGLLERDARDRRAAFGPCILTEWDV